MTRSVLTEAAQAGKVPRLKTPTKRRGSAMTRFVLNRLGFGFVVVVLVVLTVFVLTRAVSDPALTLAGFESTEEDRELLRKQLGLDQPLFVQFAIYLGQLVRFDLGFSFWQNIPVSQLVAAALPNTILLIVVGIGFAVVVGVLLGIVAALRPGSKLDSTTSAVSLLGLSIPQFWMGAMFILLFAVILGWLPTSGMGDLKYMILPAITLGLPSLAKIAQMTRTSMVDELSRQHILVARAKGLSTRYIVFRHALRNVLVPVSTIVSYESVSALAGSAIIVETVFAWPGIGYLLVTAIRREDLILVQGVVLVVAVIVVIWNLLTDILYKFIDPRIEL